MKAKTAYPFKIKIVLSYDGTDFLGWQRQSQSPDTIQECLETALSKVFNEPLRVCASGRTDAGVHALAQVAHAWLPKDPNSYNLLHALNGLTPDSIAIHQVQETPLDFHAIASSMSKTYQYLILNCALPSALRHRYTHWVRAPLDLQLLRRYSEILVGEHDFKSFQSRGTEVPDTRRRVLSASWSALAGHILRFEVCGTGFLKQMVRNLVGTQLDLALKNAPPEEFLKVLQARDRTAAGSTAPAKGLYLCSVRYPEALDNKCRNL